MTAAAAPAPPALQKCLEGEMDQDLAFAISDEELEEGYRLICIGSSLSDVVLDA